MEIRKTCLIFNLMPSPMIQREENIKRPIGVPAPTGPKANTKFQQIKY